MHLKKHQCDENYLKPQRNIYLTWTFFFFVWYISPSTNMEEAGCISSPAIHLYTQSMRKAVTEQCFLLTQLHLRNLHAKHLTSSCSCAFAQTPMVNTLNVGKASAECGGENLWGQGCKNVFLEKDGKRCPVFRQAARHCEKKHTKLACSQSKHCWHFNLV